MNRKISSILSIILIISFLYVPGCGFRSQPEILHVVIPYSDNIQDIDTNFYINYLEDKTGLDLVVSYARIDRCDDYLELLFASDADIDIVMFGGDFVPSDDVLEEYVSRGDIYLPDGSLNYVNEGWDTPDRTGTVLWINKAWLVSLRMPVPETFEDLEKVLDAFKNEDPNGNGIKDEIPLAGSVSEYDLDPVEFILNSYVYNDPYHSRFCGNESDAECVAFDPKYREGLLFCNSLYERGLIDNRFTSCSKAELCELVNSPVSLVGAFTASSIGDVIYQGNPEIMAKYVHVPPLTGPDGTAYAIYSDNDSKVGAVILSRSEKKESARLLLDTMMTEEASLIARFGEPGVDWDYSEGKDVSIYRTPSTIITKNYIRDTFQNKNLNGIGPMRVPEEFLYGVTWNGLNSDTEYVDARAQMAYVEYLPEPGDVSHERNEELSGYLDGWLMDFVTGEKDVSDDETWEEYVTGAEGYLK